MPNVSIHHKAGNKWLVSLDDVPSQQFWVDGKTMKCYYDTIKVTDKRSPK